MAARFDIGRLELTGAPASVLDDIAEQGDAAAFSFSGLGSLVYIPNSGGSEGRTLVWVDRKGAAQSLAVPPQGHEEPRLSPDGRKLAVCDVDDIWLYDILGKTSTRLTFGGNNCFPVWSSDGQQLAFSSIRGGRWAIFWKPADGSGPDEMLMKSDHSITAQAWSPDGQMLAFRHNATTGFAIGVLPRGGEPRLFLQTAFTEIEPSFSPDGRWLAYASNETGRFEIYVQPFPGPGGKWQLSTEGGREPVWARNPRELFYRNGGKMMVVDVTMQPNFHAAKPRMLFEGHYAADPLGIRNYDVTPDGQRFIMVKPSDQELAATQIDVVLNWFEDLQRRVGPAGKQ